MANALGIDLGEVYRTVEAVKTSRAARGAAATATANTNAINQAAATANPADPATMAPLIALDPAKAKAVTDAYTALDEAGRAKLKAQNEQLGQLAAGVLSAPDPAAAYTQLIAALPPEAQGSVPPQYDENWVRARLGQATEIDKIYDSFEAQANDARDQTNAIAMEDHEQANRIALEATKSDNTIRETVAKAETEGGGALDTAASNAVSRATAALFGGTFGPDGSFGGMDQQQAVKALEVAAEAEKLMQATPGLSINDAVRRAAEAVGYKVSGTNQTANNVIANNGNPMATGPTNDPFELGL